MNKIGIIGAMDVEISIFREEMQKNGSLKESAAGSLVFYEGILSEKNVVVVKSGVGKVNAALCAQRLILQFGVDAVINTGIAGAMEKSLGIFDMVASTEAIYHDVDAVAFGYKICEIPQMKESVFKADKKLVSAAENAFHSLSGLKGKQILSGRIASGDQFIADKEKKLHIQQIANPFCVEMEGAAIAHACYLNKIPFVILRCMSDMADESYESSYSFNEKDAAEESASVVLQMLKNL